MGKRILVSGFEPFGGEALNPTSLLVEALLAAPEEFGAPAKVQLHGCLLPVTFEDAFKKLHREIRVFDPDVVLSLGLAGGRAHLEIERVAINCLDANIPDNSGVQPRDLPIDPLGSPAHFTTLPMRELLAALEHAGVPARISNSAGTYVCNFLFYRLIETNLRTRRKCGFVHVPYLPEQATDKPGAPSMPLEQMKAGLRAMIGVLGK